MRSLLVTRMSPFPPAAGVPLRVAAFLSGLARLGPVDVIVVGQHPKGPVPDYIDTVRSFDAPNPAVANGWRSLISRRHPLAASLHGENVEKAIAELGAGPGLIVLSEVWLEPYLEAARATGRPVIYDSHNVEAVLRREIASVGSTSPLRRARREVIARQVKAMERRMVTDTDQSWVCSDKDRRALLRIFGQLDTLRVVPNGVDSKGLSAEVHDCDEVPEHIDPDHPNVIFLGDLAYTPNADGALYLLNEVLPIVVSHLPEVRAVFVGRNPTAELVEAAEGSPNAVVTGEVPRVLPYLAHGDVLAVTLRIGGGTRLKILEGMAAGMPIVTTSKGLEGIYARHGEHLLIADSPEALASEIVGVLTNPEEARVMVKNSSELVDRSYSWTAIGNLIAESVEEIQP